MTAQRVQAAEELLELTDHPVEWIADEVGFGNAAALRHHFTRVRGVSPQQYRRTFAGRATDARPRHRSSRLDRVCRNFVSACGL